MYHAKRYIILRRFLMNKIVKRSYYAVMVALIVLIAALLLFGCQNNSGGDFDTPEFVYLPEVTPFPMPDGVNWINGITFSGDLVYFAGESDMFDEDIQFSFFDIYTMDLNGSNMSSLPNFDVNAEFPAEAEAGNVQIYSVYVDKDENIWIAERGEFYYFDIPEDFDGEDWEIWDYRKMVKDFTRVRKLDNTGAEIRSFDIGHIYDGQDWFHIYAFTLDDDNNVYIAVESSLYVLDSEGNDLFTLDTGWTERLIKTQDGSIALTMWRDRGRVLVKVDVAGKSWGESLDLPSNAHNVHQGNDEFSFLFHNHIGLFGVEAATDEVVSLVNWIDSDISLDGLGSITFHPDGRILIFTQNWGSTGPNNEIILLSKTPYSELPERIVLTLATFHLDWNIRDIIVQFNRSSLTHRIQVIDYSEFSTDDNWQAGLTRLSTEIISGNVPDILDVSNLPFNQYVAKGLLMDLYPLIDSDPELSRGDLMESVLRVAEINGGLYRIFPSFSIGTLIGNPAVVGSAPGWNTEEFLAILDANPDADFPLGQGVTKLIYLQALFMITMDNFVDWGTGTTSFDSNDFMDLLMFADTFPEEYDWDSDYLPESALIPEGRQIMAVVGFNDFEDYQMYRALFGGEIVFKGFPNESRNGNSLITNTGFAITTSCKDVDAAWQFIRTFISEDYQSDNFRRYGLPVNKNVFDKMLEDAMTENEHGPNTIGWNDFLIELNPLTQAEADQIMAFINSVTISAGQDEAIWNIVSEGAADFFNGRSSIQDTVKVIQNRASIYVSEQS